MHAGMGGSCRHYACTLPYSYTEANIKQDYCAPMPLHSSVHSEPQVQVYIAPPLGHTTIQTTYLKVIARAVQLSR